MPPLKLAIVGAGPSAFYVASRILSLFPQAKQTSGSPINVHLFDRLWAPHGLVRYGVAPDHPEVKNCTHKFDTTATDPRFRFFGNVNIGEAGKATSHAVHVPLSSIFKNYTHVLFATGCTMPRLHAALPPSEHCLPALSLVHWYTQHPEKEELPPPPLIGAKHVSIIGNGNVSLDVARMLLTNVSVLSKYDVPQSVLEVLSKLTIEHVSIIARRGPLEAAFTMKELRELINLPEASMVPLDPALLVPPTNASLTRQQSRVLQLLEKGSKNIPGTTPKSWSLDFFRSPTGLSFAPPSSRSSQISLAHTTVDPATMRAVPTGDTSILNTDLVVTSLGFQGEPTAEFYDPGLGHLRTVSGRVITSGGMTLKNVYASGWAATGAKGVLATTMMNAYATADTILSDWLPRDQVVITTPVQPNPDISESGVGVAKFILNQDPHPEEPPEEIKQAIEDGRVFDYRDWKKIDSEEIIRGEALGKERERMDWEQAQNFLGRT